MERRTAKKLKLLLGVLVIALSIWAAAASVEDFLNPIRSVSEVAEQPESYMNRTVQVAGFIVKESIQREGSVYKFNLTYRNATMGVIYSGSEPVPVLNPGVGVTVIGVLKSRDAIASNKILIKCPSKYQEEAEGKSGAQPIGMR